MRIAFVWDWEPNYYQSITWEDGLAGALKVLIDRGHEVAVMCAGDTDNVIKHPLFDMHVLTDIPKFVKEYNPDVVLHWADMTRPNAIETFKMGIPQAICFAGGEPLAENVALFDHIFVESQVYEDVFKERGYSVSRAFGTNTELFKPMDDQPKVFDTIFPATFAAWKRHEIYARATKGLTSLAVGYRYHDHEQECWQVCLDNDVMILPHVSAQTLHELYAASRVCVVPSLSSGGSQRTVLEAMSMNLPLIITDSDKFDFAHGHGAFVADPDPNSVRALINMALESEVSTRDYIVENWSEYTYADALEAGLKGILK